VEFSEDFLASGFDTKASMKEGIQLKVIQSVRTFKKNDSMMTDVMSNKPFNQRFTLKHSG